MVSEAVLNDLANKVRTWMDLIIQYGEKKEEKILNERWNLEKDIVDNFFKIEGTKQKYDYKDVIDKIYNISFRFKKSFKKITIEEIKKYLKELIEEKIKENFLGIIEIPQLENFPDNLDIGSSKIKKFEKLPDEFKKRIKEELEYEYDKKKKTGETKEKNKDKFFKNNISDYWAVRKIDAVGFYKLYSDAEKLINKDLNILRLTYDFNIDQIPFYQKKIYLYDEKRKEVYKFSRYTNKIPYISVLDENIKFLNNIFVKEDKKKTDIEKRIELTLELACISIESKVSYVKFMMLMAALEGLVLNRSDVLYGLTKQLSKKIPLIIEKDTEKRLKLSKILRDYYNLRSEIAHATKKSIKISDGDVKILLDIYKATIFGLLELQKNNGIEQIAKDNKKPSLDEYIDKLCFS